MGNPTGVVPASFGALTVPLGPGSNGVNISASENGVTK